MCIRLKAAVLGGSLFNNFPAGAEHGFFTAVHNLICTGVLRIGVLNYVIRVQVVLKVSVGNGRGVYRIYILRFGKGFLPAVVHMLICLCKTVRKAVGGHMLFDLRHQIVAVLVVDLVPPAEMIESVVTYAHFLPGFQTYHVGHFFLQVNGHIADI